MISEKELYKLIGDMESDRVESFLYQLVLTKSGMPNLNPRYA